MNAQVCNRCKRLVNHKLIFPTKRGHLCKKCWGEWKAWREANSPEGAAKRVIIRLRGKPEAMRFV